MSHHFYIPRRLNLDPCRPGESTEHSSGDTSAFSEGEILAQEWRVLILLAEPGAGKTTFAQHFIHAKNGHYVMADDVADDPSSLPQQDIPLLMIDGIDECRDLSRIERLLRKLPANEEGPRILLTCRAAEWEAQRWGETLARRFGHDQVKVACFHPFAPEEIHELIRHFARESNGTTFSDEDARNFRMAAFERGLSDWLENPENLRLLLEATRTGNTWPETRGELFEQAVRHAAEERNPQHRTGDRPSEDDLLEIAGKICATILLAGERGIARTTSHEGYPRHADLLDESERELADQVLKTRLFRPDGPDRLLPIHRSMAEFLAARWLAVRLVEGRLSQKRLFQLIIPFRPAVRISLRGLHGWLSSFITDPMIRQKLIKALPLTIFLYGDPARLQSVKEKECLLNALKTYSERYPALWDTDHDGIVPTHPKFATPDIGDKMREILADQDVRANLKAFLLTIMKDSALAQQLTDLLTDYYVDASQDWMVRRAALKALPIEANLSETVSKLAEEGTKDSQNLLADIIRERGEQLDADKLGAALVTCAEKMNDTSIPWRLCVALKQGKFRHDQLASLMNKLAHGMERMIKEVGAQKWDPTPLVLTAFQLSLLHRYLEAAGDATPELLWRWLRFCGDGSEVPSKVRGSLAEYFKRQLTLKRNLQAFALKDRDFAEDHWMAIHLGITHYLPFLNMEKADILYHMRKAAEESSEPDVKLWLDIVRAFRNQRDPEINALVQEHRERFPALDEAYCSVEWDSRDPQIEEWNQRDAERRRQETERRRRNREERIRRFEEEKDAALSDEDSWGWLCWIAKALLGFYHDIEGENYEERIADLVGDNHVEDAKRILLRFLKREDLPGVKDLVDLHRQGQSHKIEIIMPAAILLHRDVGGELDSLSPRAVEIGAFRDVGFPKATKWSRISAQLREGIFADPDWAERFLRDWFESHFETGASVPHIHWLRDKTLDRELASRLALEWIERFAATLPGEVASTLFSLAAEAIEKERLQALAKDHLRALDEQPEFLRPWWAAFGFAAAFDDAEVRSILRRYLKDEAGRHLEREDGKPPKDKDGKNIIWVFRDFLAFDRRSAFREDPARPLTTKQIVFLVEIFAPHWPPCDLPEGVSIGSANPWDATHFLRKLMDMLAQRSDPAADADFQALIGNSAIGAWHDILRTHREHWLARIHGTKKSGLEEVRAVLRGGTPRNIQDLKATVLEALENLQERIQRGDTQMWENFWKERKDPEIYTYYKSNIKKDNNKYIRYDNHKEEYCRDRILEQLRDPLGHLQTDLRSEGRQREGTRADIVASIMVNGRPIDLPIEIKGQWHTELWTAATEQLAVRYAKYDHGIYLVLWFGEKRVLRSRKESREFEPAACTPHRARKCKPSGPEELREWLETDMPAEVRKGIEVFVLDVTPPDFEAEGRELSSSPAGA